MAIKIIKDGFKKVIYHGKCIYCGCDFEYEHYDTVGQHYDQREGF